MADIGVRDLSPSRWPEYCHLRLEALRDSPQAFGSSYKDEVDLPNEHWIGRLRDAEERRSVSLFAERDGELLGMIGAFFEAGPEVATAVAVYVRPGSRGQGAGRLLVSAVLDRLRELLGTRKAKLMVNVEQTLALELYRGAGFVEVGTERVPLGDGKIYDELVLERPLH